MMADIRTLAILSLYAATYAVPLTTPTMSTGGVTSPRY